MAGMAGLAESLQSLVEGSKHQTEVAGKLEQIITNQGLILAAIAGLGGRVERVEALMAEKVANSDASALATFKLVETAEKFPSQVIALTARIEASERVVAAALGAGLGPGLSAVTKDVSAALLRLEMATAENRESQARAAAEVFGMEAAKIAADLQTLSAGAAEAQRTSFVEFRDAQAAAAAELAKAAKTAEGSTRRLDEAIVAIRSSLDEIATSMRPPPPPRTPVFSFAPAAPPFGIKFTLLGAGLQNLSGGLKIKNSSIGHKATTCSIAVPNDAVWKIRINTMDKNNWLGLGVIGTTDVSNGSSYSIASAFMWAAGTHNTYSGGKMTPSLGGWSGFKQGDTCLFKLAGSTLRMRCERLAPALFEIPLTGSTWYAHANLLGADDEIEVLTASALELASI